LTPPVVPAVAIDLTEDDDSVAITDHIEVAQLEELDDAPEYWSVPRPGNPSITYLLDLRGPAHADRLIVESGKSLTIDAYIKKQATLFAFYWSGMFTNHDLVSGFMEWGDRE